MASAKHFPEKLTEGHGYRLGYTVTRLALQAAGLVGKAPRRGAHRRRRPRRPMPGMMLHQDGSTHAWLRNRPPLDLIATLDDATSEIYSAFLVAQEGTASSFRGLAEVIATKGPSCSLYTDRGSHYFHTPVAGGGVDRQHPIAAYSPQARGRSERLFGTLQDRVPKELALAGITDIDTANAWLREVHLPMHSARFAVAAEQEGTAFVAVAPEQWREVLCLQETRQVGNDNTVRWRGRRLQIPKSPLRPHFVRATVRLHEYPDGATTLFCGPHRIAAFPPPGAEPDDLAA